MACASFHSMGVQFTVRDRDSNEALSGVIVWREYGCTSLIPFTGGAIEVHSVGAYTGAHKGYEVWVDGYVPHVGDFIQNNGRAETVLLSRYADYLMPEPPVTPPVVPQPSPLSWLTLIGLGALLLH